MPNTISPFWLRPWELRMSRPRLGRDLRSILSARRARYSIVSPTNTGRGQLRVLKPGEGPQAASAVVPERAAALAAPRAGGPLATGDGAADIKGGRVPAGRGQRAEQ